MVSKRFREAWLGRWRRLPAVCEAPLQRSCVQAGHKRLRERAGAAGGTAAALGGF